MRSAGMEYVHLPVQFAAPTEGDLLAFFGAMDVHQDKKVLVHCAANMRVTAFLGLYWAIRKKQSPAQAFALMATVWEPDEVWKSFIEAMLQRYRV